MSAMAVSVRSQYFAVSGSRTGMMSRLGIGLVFAVFMTIALLWVMNYLIDVVETEQQPPIPIGPLYNFTRTLVDPPITKPPIVRPIPDPPPTPAGPPRGTFETDTVAIPIPPMGPVKIPVPSGPGKFGGVASGDPLPVVKVAPIYPVRALERGIEGFCTVQYTITRQGGVRDPVVLEDQCTNTLFHNASINAALKFKYTARMIDGVAVELQGKRNRFIFEIKD